ncbi:MAG: DUF2029 domain-containing protein [Tatlockia sp.]|nr:DUF2029 domain-containing protein [Tatlockia sp.]
MSNRYLDLIIILVVMAVYSLLIYSVLSVNYIQDFTSFYAAILNLVDHKDPYQALYSNFLPISKKLSANLNPPFSMFMFSFLAKFSYQSALIIWVFLSLILGLFGAGLAFYHAFSYPFLKKNWLYLFIIYLSLFSTMINITVAQFGLILLFFIMAGYHFYIKNNNLATGIFWGTTIAFKFFPALLLVFIIKQRRYKAFSFTFCTALMACSIPYFLYGRAIYSNYMSMFSRVSWYGDNWNASLFGYIYRLFIHNKFFDINLIILKFIYVILFFICFFWYIKKMGENNLKEANHQPFCLTLTMMLLMSPFGWLYYFPILIFPLLLAGIYAYKSNNFSLLIFIFSLSLINLPQGYILPTQPASFLLNLSSYSSFFYGLILLNYLSAKRKILLGNNELAYDSKNQGFILISSFIVFFALIFTALRFIPHLF